MIGVIILNFEDWSSTERTLKSVLQHESNLSILIVDNGSKSTRSYFGTNDQERIKSKLAQKYELLLNQKKMELNVRRSDQNLGFSKGHNFGLDYFIRLGLTHVCCLNSDLLFNAPSISGMREDMIINGAALGSFAIVDSFGKLDRNLYRKLKKVQQLFVELIWFGPYKEPKKNIIESVLNGSVVEVPSGAAFMFDLSLWWCRPCMPSDVFLYNEEFILGVYAKNNGWKIFQSERLHCKHLGGISSTGAHILQVRKTLYQSHSIYCLYHNHMRQNKVAVTFVSFVFALKSLPLSALKDIKYCVKNFFL